MAIKKFKPESPDKALGKIKGDTEFARLGHLNRLVDDVDGKKANQEIYKLDYPFVYYPESRLFNTGPTYEYPGGIGMGPIPAVTLNSYKIKGIYPHTNASSTINAYLGTIKIIPNTSGWMSTAVLFPGKLTGMVIASNTYVQDLTSDLTCSPLADGALLWDGDTETFVKLNDVRVMLYAYDANPDPSTGEVNYAVVLEGYTVPGTDIGVATISYEFEFVTASDAKTTLWFD